MSGTIVVPEHNLEFSNQIILCRLRYGIRFFRIPILLFRVSGSGFFIKTRGRRERYPTKFWKCWGPGTGKILKVGYRLVPGTDQILKAGYRVPSKFLGTNGYRVPARKNCRYRWVPRTGKIFTYADPWLRV